MIRCDGIYRSALIPWEESHGGAHWAGVSVQFWRFFSNGRWLRCISENHELPFWEISQRQPDAPPGPAVSGQITGGSYVVTEELLRIREPSLLRPKYLTYEWVFSGDRLIPHEPSVPGHVELSFAGRDHP